MLAIAPSILFGCIMSAYRGYYEGLRNIYPTAISQVMKALTIAFRVVSLLAYCSYIQNSPEDFANFVNKFNVFGKYTAKSVTENALIFMSAASILGITLSTAAGRYFSLHC